jgi:hypothetical protein
MKTSTAHPAINLATQLYYQLVYTLMALLPPPLDDTPEALRARNHAAVAKVAALLPVNANEIELAAQCIAARAQAEETLRLVRHNAGDIELVMRLNAQYGSTVRTSLAVHGRLMRVQALRRKREAIDGAATEDARVLQVVERSMLWVVNPKARPVEVARVEVPSACADQTTAKNVSKYGINSHDVGFETGLSEQPWSRGSEGSDKVGPGEVVRRAMARARLGGRDLPAEGLEGAGRAD